MHRTEHITGKQPTAAPRTQYNKHSDAKKNGGECTGCVLLLSCLLCIWYVSRVCCGTDMIILGFSLYIPVGGLQDVLLIATCFHHRLERFTELSQTIIYTTKQGRKKKAGRTMKKHNHGEECYFRLTHKRMSLAPSASFSLLLLPSPLTLAPPPPLDSTQARD